MNTVKVQILSSQIDRWDSFCQKHADNHGKLHSTDVFASFVPLNQAMGSFPRKAQDKISRNLSSIWKSATMTEVDPKTLVVTEKFLNCDTVGHFLSTETDKIRPIKVIQFGSAFYIFEGLAQAAAMAFAKRKIKALVLRVTDLSE